MDTDPYQGNKPFGVADRHRFFGRAEEAEVLCTRWRGSRLVVLCGPAGVGKTSLLHAGVVPLFGPGRPHRPADVLPVGRVTPRSEALAGYNPYQLALLSGWSPQTPPERLAGLSIAEALHRRRRLAGGQLPILAAVDQFEELYADLPGSAPYRRSFLEELTEAVASVPDVHLLISIREEWVDELAPYEGLLGGVAAGRVRLRPLGPDAALEAVTKPVEATSRSYAPDVAERLVDDLRVTVGADAAGEPTVMLSGSVEPLHLQLACTGLWRGSPASAAQITEAARSAHGDVDEVIAEFCRRAVVEVGEEHGIPVPALWRWLAGAFVTELGTRGTAYEGAADTAGLPSAVARSFERRHILRTDRRADTRWYWLSHGRLVAPIRAAAGLPVAASGSPWHYLRAAESALADGDLPQAARHAEQAIAHSGDRDAWLRADATSLLADIAARAGQPDAAERYYEAVALFAAIEDLAAVGRVLAARGCHLLAAGRLVEAIVDLQAAARALPGDVGVRIDLARAFRRTGQLQAAHSILTDVLTIAPDTVDALVGRGQILISLDYPEAGLDDLDTAVRLVPAMAVRPDVREARELAHEVLAPTGEPAA